MRNLFGPDPPTRERKTPTPPWLADELEGLGLHREEARALGFARAVRERNKILKARGLPKRSARLPVPIREVAVEDMGGVTHLARLHAADGLEELLTGDRPQSDLLALTLSFAVFYMTRPELLWFADQFEAAFRGDHPVGPTGAVDKGPDSARGRDGGEARPAGTDAPRTGTLSVERGAGKSGGIGTASGESRPGAEALAGACGGGGGPAPG
jgi:hypothetical protein